MSESKEMDARLDAIFGAGEDDNVTKLNKFNILTQDRERIQNTIWQAKKNMRVALRLNDKAQQDALREQVKQLLGALDEHDTMLRELEVATPS